MADIPQMISAIFILNTTYSIFLLLLLLQHLPSSSFFHNAMSPHGSLSVISQITGSCGFSTSSLFRQLTVYSYGTCYQGPDNLASGSRTILLRFSWSDWSEAYSVPPPVYRYHRDIRGSASAHPYWCFPTSRQVSHCREFLCKHMMDVPATEWGEADVPEKFRK